MADESVPEERAWVIYELHMLGGLTFYVGATSNLKRRMKEHRQTFGSEIRADILKRSSGPGRLQAEHWWIERFRAAGYPLTNKTVGRNGNQGLSDESRALVSAFHKGRPKSPEHRAKIGAANRGKPRNWSPEGRARVEATQFKPGHRNTPEQLEVMLAATKGWWASIPPEERSQMISELNVKIWRDPEARARRIEGLIHGHANTPAERRSEIAKVAGLALHAKYPTAASERSKRWWASLSSEERKDYLERRGVAISKGILASKQRQLSEE